MSSIVTAVFKETIRFLVNKGRDKAAEWLNAGDVTEEQKFRSVIVREIVDINYNSRLDGLSRKDLLATISVFGEGVELLYQVFDKARSRTEGCDLPVQAAGAEAFALAQEMRNVVTGLDESSTRALDIAKDRFKDARREATRTFKNKALTMSDRILAMEYRVMATILETIDNPAVAIAPCRVCIEEVNCLSAVKNSFNVELRKGIMARFNKGGRRQIISRVCRLNRVIFDVTRVVGKEEPLWMSPKVDTEQGRIDPLRDERVFEVLRKQGMEHCFVAPLSFTHEGVEEHRVKTPHVPPEIVVRGRLALEAYNKALAEGKTFDNRVPVMLIGQDRSGKTSLKRSLRGEPFNPHEESTVGIDVDPSHFQVSTEIWKAGEKDQETISKTSISYESHAARATVKNLQQGKSVLEEKNHMSATILGNDDFISTSPASNSCVSDLSSTSTQAPQSPQSPMDTNNDFISVSPASYSSASDVSMDSELGSNISHIPKDIENEMLKRMQNDHKMEDEESIYSVLWDFAGQSVYYATHPLFLTPRAMYLLVNDLSQNPFETAKPVVKQGVYRKFEDSFGMKTNLDYLDFWMSSVASLACQNERGLIGSNSDVLPEKFPPVFLVCTHADRPYNGGDPSTLARELFGNLQTKPYNKHLHDVFVVDNTKSGLESECPEVVRLRNEVLSIAKELPQMKEAIPIKWLKFERELQAASKEGHKWISLETATQIASERCNVVDSKEFKTLLNFLHDKRILIHFDDTPELNELVVLDPQWLIDVFKKVISVKPYDRQGKQLTELWQKLENKGILDEHLLEQVWGPLYDDRATCESLLQIMGKFSLLCPWPSSDCPCGKQYLVPAMLRTHPPEDILKLVEVASKTIPPLFLKFESGQVPPGLFPRLVLLFLQRGEEIFLIPERTKLFHSFARFFTSEEENWSAILLCLSTSIKVVVHRENPNHESRAESVLSKRTLSADPSYDTSDVTFPCKVRRQLGKILESMRNEFCWLKYMRYEASFTCPVCCQGGAAHYCDTHHVQGCKQEECLHFWSQSKLCNAKRIISCTKSVAAVNSRVQIVQFAQWFTALGNQETGNEHDGDNLASVEESEAKALVLSSGVLKSLQTTCDAENVVALLPESLKLDEATLTDPGPEETRLIRCLSKEAKSANRLDVVKYLRQITPAGTTGPLLPESRDVKAVSPSLLRELTIHLCGGEEWKLLAEKLGLSPAEIRFLDSRAMNPCIEFLCYIRNQRFIDVGTLYDALVECGFPMLADML